MGFLQKNINIFLMLLVLFVAIALAASSVYYQDTFKELTDKHENTMTNLSVCEAGLNSAQNRLNKTMQTLNTTSADIRRYDELYSTKIGELSDTQGKLSTTSTELSKSKNDLVAMISLKDKYRNDYTTAQADSDKYKGDLAVCTAQQNAAESDLTTLKGRIDNGNDCIDDFVSDYSATLTQDMQDDIDDCQQSKST